MKPVNSFFGLLLSGLVLAGCGYTTQFRVQGGGGDIYLSPVVNGIEIASGEQGYSERRTYPLLIEKELTNALSIELNVRGAMNLVSDPEGVPRLECVVENYQREALRYDDDDEVVEQRLRVHVHIKLFDSSGTLEKDRVVVGETTFFLSGAYAVSESAAVSDLVADAAKRIVEAVALDW